MTPRRRCLIGLMLLVLWCPAECSWAQGYAPEEAARRMVVPEGFAVELVAAEPLVRQPVAIDFDDQGRLWVLQYLQYPNPAGLKRVKVDRYSRTTYDRVPKPPPHGPRGADRLTILEDIDGDGRADEAHDFVSGLNLATGFAFGFGGVFVLQTPYLLFYADRDRNDVADGDPEVLLKGFGMEDTSSLANSLIWGPDGWLYGTQGTNITANIRGIEFEQGLWRYHPITRQFELFAEGGGNMWGLDFDRHGNLLAGTNHGGYLVFHGVQGAYYRKSFAKHGELHNPFAFGYFEHVPHTDFQGGHVTVGGFLYQGDAFPSPFRDKYIALDTLDHAVRWHHVRPDGSTFRTENGGVLVESNDTWFAPSDAVMGPDGAVYIADWHDQRTAHPDPDATWDRSNGRVFRLKWKAAPETPHIDPQSLSSGQLVDWLDSSNQWKVRRARRVLASRRDDRIADRLAKTLREANDDHQALEALWTLSVVGGLDNNLKASLLAHRDPSVRAWTVRLIGDQPSDNEELLQSLVSLADSDTSPVVISQLACTAKRLPAEYCISLAGTIAAREGLTDDPHIPLLTWWAIERYAISASDGVLKTFTTPDAWKRPIVSEVILGRLMRRFAGDGSRAGFAAAARLLKSAPDASRRRRLIGELDAGLKMLSRQRRPGLPLGTRFAHLAVKQLDDTTQVKRLQTVPVELANSLEEMWSESSTDPLIIRVAIRLGSQAAHDRAVALATDATVPVKTRLSMLAILDELGASSCVEHMLNLVDDSESKAIQLAAMKLLRRFDDRRIPARLLTSYSTMDRTLRSTARDVMLGRADSAMSLLRAVARGEYPLDEVTIEDLRRVALHNDPRLDALVRKHWGNVRAGTPEEKLAEIRRLTNDLRAGSGHIDRGKQLFEKQCSTCHKLFSAGNEIGPDLTNANRHDSEYLLVSMVDPSAQIRKEFLSYIVETIDGRIITGLLSEETPVSVTVLDANNERTSIARDDIEQLKVSPVSLMPEDQLKKLSPQEVRDLFRYLQSKSR